MVRRIIATHDSVEKRDGEPFDPATLTDAQAERVLAAIRGRSDLSEGAKGLYELMFHAARGGEPRRARSW